MSAHTATRIGAASGVAYVVGVLAANSAGTDTAAISFGLLALVLFVPFLASLWSVLCAADGADGWLPATVLGAGVLAVAVKLVSVLPEVVLLQGGLGPAQRDVLQRLADAGFIVAMLPLGVCMAAVAASVVRTRALPAWLGWSAAAHRRAARGQQPRPGLRLRARVPPVPPLGAGRGDRAAAPCHDRGGAGRRRGFASARVLVARHGRPSARQQLVADVVDGRAAKRRDGAARARRSRRGSSSAARRALARCRRGRGARRARGPAGAPRTGRARRWSPARRRRPAPRAARRRSPRGAAPSRTRGRGAAAPVGGRARRAGRGRPRGGRACRDDELLALAPHRAHAATTRSRPFLYGLAGRSARRCRAWPAPRPRRLHGDRHHDRRRGRRRRSSSAPAACGTSSGASRSRRRSSGRCQTPWRPGRLAAAGASKRIAPGRGHSSAAVVVE